MKDRFSKERLERRVMKINAIERNADGEINESKMTIGGYAVVFDEPQTYMFDGKSYTETIQAGALDNTDMRRVPLRYNHNDNVLVMARTKNGSLRLDVDGKGLYIEADLIDTQSNRDLYKCVKEGLLDEMSFAFTVRDGGEKWKETEKGVERVIIDIEALYDVSVVDNAFYEATNVSARCLENLDELTNAKTRKQIELERARAIAIAQTN